MPDVLLTVCGKCFVPLIVEDGCVRNLTAQELMELEQLDRVVSLLGSSAAVSKPTNRCTECQKK